VELVKDAVTTGEVALPPAVAIEAVDPAAAALRGEAEQLKLELELAKLRAEFAQINKPWWRKGSIVATMTALIAAAMPVTMGVMGYFQKEREVALAQAQKERELALQLAQQDHTIRTSYLDRIEHPSARLRTLRFVLATTNDPSLRSWAQDEKKLVEKEVDQLRQELEDKRRQLDTLTMSSSTRLLIPKGDLADEIVGRKKEIEHIQSVISACTSHLGPTGP
jgi:hypothetical protein